MITHISVKNFKNLRKVELDLRPLNVLIGPNGAGKSNFLNLFQMFSMGADERLPEYIRQQGGIDLILWKNDNQAQRDINFSIQIMNLSLVNSKDKDKINYYIGLEKKYGDIFIISREELASTDNKISPYLFAVPDRVMLNDELYYNFETDPQQFIISQVRDRFRFPILDEVRSMLKNWIFFRGFGENSLTNIHAPQETGKIVPFQLDPQGRNLIAILDTLINDARYDATFERLQDFMKAAFPYFKKFDIRHTDLGSPTRALFWRMENGMDFPTRSLSDGMLRFLGLAVLLLLPNPPSLITLDEPELGLHPKLIPLLVDMLKDASLRTQLIVTTHSPLLLEFLEPEDIVLVERDGEGAAQFGRPSKESLAKWLEDFSLGNLWTMGQLQLEQ